jgi:hypothetical protein
MRQKLLATLIIIASAVTVISPWTLRNYLTFGEFIPVRTGLGQITYIGTAVLSETFKPGSVISDIQVPWTASGPMQAVKRVMRNEARQALEEYQSNVLAVVPPPGYARMNEAQRDAIYLTRFMDFVLNNPVTTAQLAFFKTYIFAKSLGKLGFITIGFALVAIILGASDPRVRALFLLLLAYALPFSIIICYFSRYRIPIEPVVVTLAGIGMVLTGRCLQRSRNMITYGPIKLKRNKLT